MTPFSLPDSEILLEETLEIYFWKSFSLQHPWRQTQKHDGESDDVSSDRLSYGWSQNQLNTQRRFCFQLVLLDPDLFDWSKREENLKC